MPKSVPQVCPQGAPIWGFSATKVVKRHRVAGILAPSYYRLRTPKQPFAYTQTTVCVYPNNCSRTPKQPFGYTQTQLSDSINLLDTFYYA